MRRITALVLACLLAMSLSGCKKVDAEPVPQAPSSAAPENVEIPAEGFVSLTGDALEEKSLASVSISAIVTEGRTPEGEYDLPTEVSTVEEWVIQGGVALLRELRSEEAAFYIVEGKESSLALIRWGESLAEFDFLCEYQPEMWLDDLDDDGAEELALCCQAGHGTGVSIEELHVIEKSDDGALTAYTYPMDDLGVILDDCLQLAFLGERTYVSLGRELAEITRNLEGATPKYENNGLQLGHSICFYRTEMGFFCRQGIMLEAEKLYYWYVGELYSEIYYRQDGTFLVDALSVGP